MATSVWNLQPPAGFPAQGSRDANRILQFYISRIVGYDVTRIIFFRPYAKRPLGGDPTLVAHLLLTEAGLYDALDLRRAPRTEPNYGAAKIRRGAKSFWGSHDGALRENIGSRSG